MLNEVWAIWALGAISAILLFLWCQERSEHRYTKEILDLKKEELRYSRARHKKLSIMYKDLQNVERDYEELAKVTDDHIIRNIELEEEIIELQREVEQMQKLYWDSLNK